MSDRWRFRDLTREAFRNTLSRGARLLPAVALAGFLGAGSVAFLSLEQHMLRQEIDELTTEGRGVVTFGAVRAENPAEIERESCESLAHEPGVESAGLIVYAGRTDAAPIAIDALAQRASVSLFPDLDAVDVLVGDTLAGHSGLFRVTIRGEVFDARVAPPSREGTGLNYGLTFSLLPGDSSGTRCVVILDPFASSEQVATSLQSQLSVTGNPILASESLTGRNDPIQEYLSRLGRFAPVVLGLVGGLFGAVITRARTSELAVYRLSGTSRASLLTLLALENFITAGIAATVVVGAAVALHGSLLSVATAITAGLTLAGTWATIATVGSIDIAFRRPTDLAKDR